MKKIGAWLMLAAAVVLGLIGVFTGINLVMIVMTIGSAAADSSYLMGMLTGRLLVVLIVFAIAWKLFTKGRSMLSGGATAPAEPKP